MLLNSYYMILVIRIQNEKRGSVQFTSLIQNCLKKTLEQVEITSCKRLDSMSKSTQSSRSGQMVKEENGIESERRQRK